ncbi:hypothetical protein H311_02495 [Anncaliia algerae PRA109]|nr:hypothetical protein H311_02495 [Anncaliia algerae PRA109]
MYECTLYSIIDNLDPFVSFLERNGWTKQRVNYSEKIFIGQNFKLIIIPEKEDLIYKSSYDYNKNRQSICCGHMRYKVINMKEFLSEINNMNLTFKSEFKFNGYLLFKDQMTIELLIAEGEKYFAKFSSYHKSPVEGEKILIIYAKYFMNYASFIKPPLEWFNSDFAKN